MDTKTTVDRFVNTWLSEASLKEGWVSKMQDSMPASEQTLVGELAQIVEDEFITGSEKERLKNKYAEAWNHGDFASLTNQGDLAWQQWKLETLFRPEDRNIGSFFGAWEPDPAEAVAKIETESKPTPEKSLTSPEQKKSSDEENDETAGLLAALSKMDSPIFVGSDFDDISNAISGLIGEAGTQYGSGGLGSRGSGSGGGGNAEGIGGLGTRGNGSINNYRGGWVGEKPLTVKVERGTPLVSGALDASVIDKVVGMNSFSVITYCYEKEYAKNPKLFGSVTVKFTIDKDGRVSNAETKSTTLNNKVVEDCVCARFLRLKFPVPKDGGTVVISYPITFSNVDGK